MEMKQRMLSLINEMNKNIYEKDSEISLSLLAAIAGESIILLGPPGVAKSMVARRLKSAFRNARSFEYLMSRFSTPDEIFGPVSISQLKNNDIYERSTDGYLPSCDVVFLDEIWKAGPAIQNSLLTVINEKLFRNGRNETKLPLKLLVAASNELPARGEGLEALWDRFIIRIESCAIREEANFTLMMMGGDDSEDFADDAIKISNEEYAKWSNDIEQVEISNQAMDCIKDIRKALRTVEVDGAEERRDIYISDRRWKKIARLVRTSAFMHERTSVDTCDLLPMYHCLWQEPDERDAVRRIVIRAIFATCALEFAKLKQNLEDDIRNNSLQQRAGKSTARQRQRDADKKTYSDYYYRLVNHDTGHSFIVLADFRQLPEIGEDGEEGLMFQDPRNEKITVIKIYDGSKIPLGSRPISLARDNNNVYIDGLRFEIEKDKAGDEKTAPMAANATECRDYSLEIDSLADSLNDTQKRLEDNMFINDDDRREMKLYLADFYKEIAFTRQDIEKITY
ncbi:AAA family ATPase [Prevotella sp.]|uniref:AAA family ATPase n=1 Tax=Prevotella sp. TaxID=59823 RepID=UPI0026479A49|nr:AAA family ATPase [Prevotella sp.]MDN5553210.1 AAA family ATPase [Prevotella sp.]